MNRAELLCEGFNPPNTLGTEGSDNFQVHNPCPIITAEDS